MKIVTVTLGADGTQPREGWVIVNYSAPEGGRTNIGTPVKPNEETGALPSWEEIAVSLQNYMGGRPWPAFIKSKVKGRQIQMVCPDELNPVSFYAEYQPSLDQIGPVELRPSFVAIEDEVF